ncbi:MAG: fatty acid desaturase [Myxococcales bacterium]|nr:fatty acid desaturase [Myxococcales bacterium]
MRHPTEWRQIGIVAAYMGVLAVGYFLPEQRSFPLFVVACLLSFLNAVVMHNHMHRGVFHSKRLNAAWRLLLSFGNLYPASANVPGHNLVHHHFEDDGQPDWVDPRWVRFRWHLLNLIHFPNVAGPNTFSGIGRWAKSTRQRHYMRRYNADLWFGAGLTALLMFFDFWGALFFVFLPQLYGARGILRINLIQHDRTDLTSEWNHSRNFVGRAFNWIMCNNGYHTIHHNRAGLHWSELAQAHEREVQPRIDPSLDEPSMVRYLVRTFLLHHDRPPLVDVAAAERAASPTDLASRARRRAEAEAMAVEEVVRP